MCYAQCFSTKNKRDDFMGSLLDVQMSIFINNRIEPTPNNVSLLMNELNKLDSKHYEYLPSIIRSQTIDLSNGKISTVSNIAFSTITNNSKIACTDDRIDCTLTFSQDTQSDFKKSLLFCAKVLDTIIDNFHIYGNRLAINIGQLSNKLPDNILESKLGSSMVSVFNFYQEHELSDWSTNANSIVDININDNLEKINVNTQLQAGRDNESNCKILICHLDINTLETNKGYRFSKNELHDFVEKTIPCIEQILNEFVVLDNEENND